MAALNWTQGRVEIFLDSIDQREKSCASVKLSLIITLVIFWNSYTYLIFVRTDVAFFLEREAAHGRTSAHSR